MIKNEKRNKYLLTFEIGMELEGVVDDELIPRGEEGVVVDDELMPRGEEGDLLEPRGEEGGERVSFLSIGFGVSLLTKEPINLPELIDFFNIPPDDDDNKFPDFFSLIKARVSPIILIHSSKSK